jgi:excisionase family DNA binding protein
VNADVVGQQMVREVSVNEAARLLGVSRDTITRRIRAGDLEAHQEPRPQGHVWRVVIPDEAISEGHYSDVMGELQTLRKMVSMLQTQVEADREELVSKNKQIEQLHVLLQQAQAALPAPRDNRRWWQRLWRRD